MCACAPRHACVEVRVHLLKISITLVEEKVVMSLGNCKEVYGSGVKERKEWGI